GEIDHRSDIYSLGVILYEMMSGVRPFTANGPGEVMAAHLYQQPMPLCAHVAAPVALEEVVTTCLAKDPSQRFPSMATLASALEAARGGWAVGVACARPPLASTAPGGTPPSGATAQVTAVPRRRSSGLWIALSAIVVTVAGLAVMALLRDKRNAGATKGATEG